MHTVYGPEDVKPFSEAHGGNAAKIKGRWIFADGAQMFTGDFGVSFAEPPDDIRELLAVKRDYNLAKLGRVQKDFQLLKAALLGSGESFKWDESEYGAPPSERDAFTGGPDGRPALRRLQALVLKYRETLEGIDREISSLAENRRDAARRKQNDELDRQAAERDQARHDEIAKIEI
jgi:hypothetical protein